MLKIVRIESNKPRELLDIGWDPTNYCNFNCSYCFPGCNTGTEKFEGEIDILVKNFQHLFDYYKIHLGKTKINLSVSGGEPTLWKDLDKFIVSIKEKNHVYFSLISNGSRSIRWWKENANMIDNAHLSHHLEQGNVEHITSVADILHDAGSKVTVKVLMDIRYWKKGLTDINYMKKNSRNKWFITVSPVIDNSENSVQKYDDNQQKYLNREIKRIPSIFWFWKNRKLFKTSMRLFDSRIFFENGKTINGTNSVYLNRGLNFFKGWSCSIGLDRIFIDWTGELKGSCGTRLYNLPYHYNIKDPNFKKIFKPIMDQTICTKDECWCSPEIHLTKINLSQRNIRGTRTIIPITNYR